MAFIDLRNENFFLSPKIIFKNMFLEPAFTYDEEKFYVGISIYCNNTKTK